MLIKDTAEVMTMLKAEISEGKDGDKLKYNIFPYFLFINSFLLH